jgi:hypothetical protein
MPKDTSGPKSTARARRKAARAGELVATAASDAVEDGSSIEADRVEVRMGAVGRADTDELHVVQGAIGAARATDVSVQ